VKFSPGFAAALTVHLCYGLGGFLSTFVCVRKLEFTCLLFLSKALFLKVYIYEAQIRTIPLKKKKTKTHGDT